MLVKTIGGAPFGAGLNSLANIGGTLFFTSDDGGPGFGEIWKSDGTEAGTVLLKDVLASATFGRTPSYFTNVGGKLFLSTQNTGTGEIWKSDGTTSGTVLVKQFPAAGSSDVTPQNLVAAGSKLVFDVLDATGDPKLWSSDGTTTGTVLLAPGTAPTCSTVVINTNDSAAGSLRDAINCANTTPGTDHRFNIPGSGVHTISTASKLPDIFDPVVIDGYTQPGASANTNGPGLADNAVLDDRAQRRHARGRHTRPVAAQCQRRDDPRPGDQPLFQRGHFDLQRQQQQD